MGGTGKRGAESLQYNHVDMGCREHCDPGYCTVLCGGTVGGLVLRPPGQREQVTVPPISPRASENLPLVLMTGTTLRSLTDGVLMDCPHMVQPPSTSCAQAHDRVNIILELRP